MPSRRSILVTFAVIAIGVPAFLGMAGWPQPRTLEFSGLILAALLTSALAMQQSTAKDWATMPPSFVIDFTALLLLGPHAMTGRRRRRSDHARAHGSTAAALVAPRAQRGHRRCGGTGSGPGAPGPRRHDRYLHLAGTGTADRTCGDRLLRREERVGGDHRAAPHEAPVNRTWPASLLRGVPGYFIGASLAVGFVAMAEPPNVGSGAGGSRAAVSLPTARTAPTSSASMKSGDAARSSTP